METNLNSFQREELIVFFEQEVSREINKLGYQDIDTFIEVNSNVLNIEKEKK